MDSSQSQQLFLVIDHLLARRASEGIILHEKNGLLRTNLLAIAAENAAQHVDLKFPGGLFHIAHLGNSGRPRRRDPDGFGWADEFTQLTRDTLDAALLVFHQIRR